MSEQAASFQFSSRKNERDDVESVIGPTLVIKGEVSAKEDLLIMGRVEGKIDHNKTLTVHAEGKVKAAIKAKAIQVEGSVEGDMFGTERVRICETGHVVGNVYSPRVGLMEGATFKGMVDMDSDGQAIEQRFADQTGSAPPARAPVSSKPQLSAETPRNPKAAKTAGKRKGADKATEADNDTTAGDVGRDDDATPDTPKD